ncbi:MAG: hypothetical protein GY841_19800 [FCB group bacterium]|nr:hypothetical protein [FCB group bacterium]
MSVRLKTDSLIILGNLKSFASMALAYGAIQYVTTHFLNWPTIFSLVFNLIIFMASVPPLAAANFGNIIKLYSGEVSIGAPFDDYSILARVCTVSPMVMITGVFLSFGIAFFVSNELLGGLIFTVIGGIIIWPIVRLGRKLYRMLIDKSKMHISNDAIDPRDIFKASNKILLLCAPIVGVGATGIYIITWGSQLYFGILVLTGMLLLLWTLKRLTHNTVKKLALPNYVEVSRWLLFL